MSRGLTRYMTISGASLYPQRLVERSLRGTGHHTVWGSAGGDCLCLYSSVLVGLIWTTRNLQKYW
jgi:hypothetical protein